MTITTFDPSAMCVDENMSAALDQLELMPEGRLGVQITFSNVKPITRTVREFVKGSATGEEVEFDETDGTLVQVSLGIRVDDLMNEPGVTDGFKNNTVLRFVFANWAAYDYESLPAGVRADFNKKINKLRGLNAALGFDTNNLVEPYMHNGAQGAKVYLTNRHFQMSDGGQGQYQQNFSQA